MDTLPNEITSIIFENIKLITDKRQFLRTCVLYNNITKVSMRNFENNYQIKDFIKINSYCKEKFTLELCHDKYFDMIPTSYIINNNRILIQALATFNCTKTLELAKNNNCDFSSISYFATIYGNLEILKWMACNNFRFDKNLCSLAAEHGHLEVLKWGRNYNFEWGVTCLFAAKNGYLECLKWARENGATWNSNVCTIAAQNGHFKVLKWARTNGCEWDNNVRVFAKAFGHLEILKWAIDNGCP